MSYRFFELFRCMTDIQFPGDIPSTSYGIKSIVRGYGWTVPPICESVLRSLPFVWRRRSIEMFGRRSKRSKFLHYLCFRGRGIHCWHSYWATMLKWPRKSKWTPGLRGTGDSVLYFFFKFSYYSYFWGQQIHYWYFYIATMFRWPQKSR